MTDLDALLAGIVADPHNVVRWLIVADWLDDHGQPDRAELLRLHRELIRTCCEPDQHPERAAWQARIVELIDQGVTPCVPQHTLMLPGGVPLVGNFIPPGSFLMGGEEEENEKPVRRESLATGFFIGLHPVTQKQWAAVIGTDPSHFKGENRPVDSVNWNDASAFCEKASQVTGATIRLPGEAEWEYACRAGTTTHYHFGDEPSLARMNFDHLHGKAGERGEPHNGTSDVGSFASGPWGLFDMHGNVLEWCADGPDTGYDAFTIADEPISEDLRQECRALRGGCWIVKPGWCRSASREPGHIPFGTNVTGFRVVFTLS